MMSRKVFVAYVCRRVKGEASTSDGKWIVIGGNNNNVFQRLVGVLGRPELAEDARYATDKARAVRSEELDALMG